MNILKYKKFAEEGDTVVIYLDAKTMFPLALKKNEVFQTKYGALKHEDVIGSEYGTRVQCSRGWIYLLFLTAELWTQILPHRTQILYTPDISCIVFQLDLKPGCIVCEAGTGSGSLSHAIIRAIAPSGFLHTFDFHEQRVQDAQKEFLAHGIQHLVKVQHRDVCAEGFGLFHAADAVFLDLPDPWEVVEYAAKALKSGGRFCSFSPCIEQVQKTCQALRKQGFDSIITMHCVQRRFDVKRLNLPAVELPDKILNSDKEVGPITKLLVTKQKEKVDVQGGVTVDSSSEGKPVASYILDDGKTKNRWAAVPPREINSHTGYLTFASFCFPVSKSK